MADSEGGSEGKKENLCLSANSLNALAREVSEKCLVLGMYLCVPTTQLVRMKLAANEKGATADAMTAGMLESWKEMRATAKEKEKASDLERALREMGKLEIADIVLDKFQSNSEMTADCFPTA